MAPKEVLGMKKKELKALQAAAAATAKAEAAAKKEAAAAAAAAGGKKKRKPRKKKGGKDSEQASSSAGPETETETATTVKKPEAENENKEAAAADAKPADDDDDDHDAGDSDSDAENAKCQQIEIPKATIPGQGHNMLLKVHERHSLMNFQFTPLCGTKVNEYVKVTIPCLEYDGTDKEWVNEQKLAMRLYRGALPKIVDLKQQKTFLTNNKKDVMNKAQAEQDRKAERQTKKEHKALWNSCPHLFE